MSEEEIGEEGTDEESSDEKFHRIMANGWDKGKGPKLPSIFKLNNPYPGEPPFMKLRRQPSVLRFHKYKADKDPEAYWFSEALLYLPHYDEEDLVVKITNAKSEGIEKWDFPHSKQSGETRIKR